MCLASSWQGVEGAGRQLATILPLTGETTVSSLSFILPYIYPHVKVLSPEAGHYFISDNFQSTLFPTHSSCFAPKSSKSGLKMIFTVYGFSIYI